VSNENSGRPGATSSEVETRAGSSSPRAGLPGPSVISSGRPADLTCIGETGASLSHSLAVGPPPSLRVRRAIRDQRVRRVAMDMTHEHPWWTKADMPIVNAWSQFEVLSREVYSRIHREGVVRPDGTPNPLLMELARLRKAQGAIGSNLGIGPRSRAEVAGGTRGASLDGAFERIAKAHEERHGAEAEDAEETEK
jgi:hypothetical protein